MEESTQRVSKVSKKRHSKAISWSQKENDYFLSLVKKRKHSIARKEGRNKKSQAWAEIVEEMKDFFGPKYNPSDMRRIRSKWQKMKTKAQTEIDNLKNQSIKQLSNQSQIVCDILNVNLNDNASKNYIIRQADKKNDSAFSKSLQSNDELVNAFSINIMKTEKDSDHIKETDNERDLSLFMENSQINELALESESDGHIEVVNEQELNKNNFDDENINGPNQSQVPQTAGGGDIDPGYEQDGSKVFDMLKLDILIKKKSAISAIWETAEINKMIAVQKLKSLIQCQRETLGYKI